MKSIVNPLKMEEILSKLNNSQLEHSEFIGIISCMIYSKDIFPINKDIAPFLKQVFNVEYLQYVLNSRTLISARITKNLLNLSESELDNKRIETIRYFKKFEKQKKNSNKKKNANDKLSTWLKGL